MTKPEDKTILVVDDEPDVLTYLTMVLQDAGFNVMSAQTIDAVSGLVAVNSLMAMVGGILAALVIGKNDPGFVHNGPLAGLVAVLCLHPGA